jgi:hypothetical protein
MGRLRLRVNDQNLPVCVLSWDVPHIHTRLRGGVEQGQHVGQ